MISKLEPWVVSILTLVSGLLMLAIGYRIYAGMLFGAFFFWTLLMYIFRVRYPTLNGYVLPRWGWMLISVGDIILLMVVFPLAAKVETLLGGVFYGAGVMMGLLGGMLGFFYTIAPEDPNDEEG